MPVSVGMRAGSHFNVPYRLEKYLPLEHIKTVNTGGFGARLKALLDGEVEAACLLPPQIEMAEQLGLRKIIEDRFKTLWWVPESADAGSRDAATSTRWSAPKKRLKRISKSICRSGRSRCRRNSATAAGTIRNSAAVRNSCASRSRSEDFDEVFKQVERWDLAQFVKDRSVQTLAFPSA